MKAGLYIREARRRAGLSQRGLAKLLGTTQAVIARWETGARTPSFDRVVDAVRACGFDLSVHIVARDEQHELLIQEMLAMTREQRVEHAVKARHALEKFVYEARPGWTISTPSGFCR